MLGVTGDGASVNRKLFRMHTEEKGKIVHKTINVYSDEAHDMFFFFRSATFTEDNTECRGKP